MTQALASHQRSLRYLRDSTPIGTVVRAPFSVCRMLGMNVPAAIYRHLPFRGVVSVRVPHGESFQIHAKGHVIENRLYWRGLLGHEGECMQAWIRLAQTARCVLDIGANTGLYSLAAGAVNDSASIHAFEPVPRIAAIARDNTALNDSMNITIHEAAVGAATGKALLHDPGGDQPSSASLVEGFIKATSKSFEVNVLTIDSFRDNQNIPHVDLIKLDVEGVEELAFAGMEKTIEACKPSILVEVLDTRPTLMDRIQALRETGYGVYYMTSSGLKSCGPDITVPENRNLLLIHRSRNIPE